MTDDSLSQKVKGIGTNMNNNTLKFDTHNDIEETARQQKFMEKAKAYVEELTCKLGRKPTYCVTTFGCPIVFITEKISQYPLLVL